MLEKVVTLQELLQQAEILLRKKAAIEGQTVITIQHPLTGEDVEFPISDDIRDRLEADLRAKLLDIKQEILDIIGG